MTAQASASSWGRRRTTTGPGPLTKGSSSSIRDIAVRQGAQPVSHAGFIGLGDEQMEAGRLLARPLEQPGAHQPAVGLQDPGRLALARTEGHRRRCSSPRCRSRGRGRPRSRRRPTRRPGLWSASVHEIVVRVAAGAVIRAQVGAAGQADDIPLGLLQQVKVDLGPVDGPVPAGVGVGPGGVEHTGDDLGQALDLGRVKAALGDPVGAQTDAAGGRARSCRRGSYCG